LSRSVTGRCRQVRDALFGDLSQELSYLISDVANDFLVGLGPAQLVKSVLKLIYSS
jgi:hypothetical protein